jgi:hypothetical protein
MTHGLDPALVDAVSDLDLIPRTHRWTSLSYCVVDAVWSIGTKYYAVTVPMVKRVAATVGDVSPSVPVAEWSPDEDRLPLPLLLERFNDESLRAVTNKNLTSSRGGIPKASAVMQYARILVDHGVVDLASALRTMKDEAAFGEVDRALTHVRGEGSSGVRRGYLWMLIGDDDLIKPDRMVLRWLASHGATVTPAEARLIIPEIAAELDRRGDPRRPTPWVLDHAMWLAARQT